MLAEQIQAVNALCDTEYRLRIVDPTLPRNGTDLIATRSRDAQC
jgi:hypothetical protein